jgi:Rrf2 family protein
LIYPQATSYAIEALAFIAGLGEGTSVKTRQISDILEIPEQYLGKVMTQLVKKKYISSSKGPTGGFELTVDPEKVTLYRIMASLDSLTPLEEDCVMGLGKCSSETPCAFHDRWSKFKEQVIAESQKLTLIDMSKILLNKMRMLKNNQRLSFPDLLASRND